MDSGKSNRSKIWIVVSILATAAVVGGGVYYSQNKQANKDQAALQETIDSLNKKLDATPISTPTPSATVTASATPAVTATPAPSDSTIIKNTAIADAEADVNVMNVSATISATSGVNFAKVSVGTSPGGYSAILKKVNSIWIVVTKGQSAPTKADGAKYGLPAGWYSTSY
jgi:hypothetical protein